MMSTTFPELASMRTVVPSFRPVRSRRTTSHTCFPSLVMSFTLSIDGLVVVFNSCKAIRTASSWDFTCRRFVSSLDVEVSLFASLAEQPLRARAIAATSRNRCVLFMFSDPIHVLFAVCSIRREAQTFCCKFQKSIICQMSKRKCRIWTNFHLSLVFRAPQSLGVILITHVVGPRSTFFIFLSQRKQLFHILVLSAAGLVLSMAGGLSPQGLGSAKIASAASNNSTIDQDVLAQVKLEVDVDSDPHLCSFRWNASQ